MDAKLQADICARIKLARTEAGYTQAEMADLLGMTLRGYQNYESNRVPFRWLDKIAELTGKTAEWLLRGDPEPVLPAGYDPREQEAIIGRLDALQDSVDRLTRALLEQNGQDQSSDQDSPPEPGSLTSQPARRIQN